MQRQDGSGGRTFGRVAGGDAGVGAGGDQDGAPAPATAGTRAKSEPLNARRLAEAIRQISPGNSAYAATEALLRAWDAPALAPAEASSSTID